MYIDLSWGINKYTYTYMYLSLLFKRGNPQLINTTKPIQRDQMGGLEEERSGMPSSCVLGMRE